MKEIDRYTAYKAFSEAIRKHYKRLHVLLEEIHVYPGQPPLLFLLDREGGLSQKLLAEKINIKPSTLTTMLKCMEANGLVEKVQDQEDKRVLRVFLTTAGQKTVAAAKKIMNRLSDEMLADFDGEEVELFYNMMEKVKGNLHI
ncbi:MarR family transcriptional regulator [Alkalibacter rhizosphaerae]|uniref:MarR family transcriptional regulator n=1 Tax=Alkalibacter rhizosphaerae TaxID=2815577 RepID=A0A974XDW6_9FIRM|nr:MarR family transcriptional regulator [Alkalibacter rhizosphaerae]QSX07931.1 MarR family transcriptional regulator [Alkalibacter rhizosphaerae]